MFTSEAVRDYRAHVTNKLSLDMNAHVDTFDRNTYFKGHPIGRGEAGPAKYSGERVDFYETRTGKPRQGFRVKAIQKLFGAHIQQWAEAGYQDTSRNCRKRPAGSATAQATDLAKRTRIMDDFKGSLLEVMNSDYNTGSDLIEDHRVIAGPLFEGPYDTREVEEPQTESVDSETNEYHEAEDLSLPLRASHAMVRDRRYVGNEIAKAIKRKEVVSGKKYEINEDSISVEDGKVTYEIYDSSDPSSHQILETDLDESKMTSNALMDEMHEQAQTLKEEGVTGKINRGLAIYGAVMGIKGTVEAFERGDVVKGTVNLAQTLHGLGELSGLSQKMYKAAGKAVGKWASKAIGRISETIGEVVGEDAGRLIAAEGGELLSTVGKLAELAEDIPIVGTVFGIYNIYEDIQQHTVIGYVDAGLDSLITVLGLLGPEAEPFVIALTIIRLGIDSFYTDIKKELDSLPPGASTGETVVAVLKGIGEGILDLADTLTGGIWSAPFKASKLDEEYRKDQAFLRQISDYHNYFKVTHCDGNTATINFAGAADSWNGGNIFFKLREGGRSGNLTMKTTGEDGKDRTRSQNVSFAIEVNDIVMGIGESNTVKFQEQSVKIFWVIPVDKKSIISGLEGDRSTLHGEYHGNSDNNKFFAVQKLPKNLQYGLEDYHYKLKGNGGDDTFYLGPQHALVEGNEGSDTYFLDGDSCHVTLFNLDFKETDDFMIIPKQFLTLSFSSSGTDVIITSGSIFKVTLKYWFRSSVYRHLVFKTSDYVVFRIENQTDSRPPIPYDRGSLRYSPVAIPYAMSAAGSNYNNLWLNPIAYGHTEVTQLIGSNQNDSMYGTYKDNIIIPGRGSDLMSGLQGADTYNIQYADGNDTIENLAFDDKLDTIVYPANASFITAIRSHPHLIIQSGSYRLKLDSWYSGANYQHATLYTRDGIFMEIRHDSETETPQLIPTLKELTTEDSAIDLMSNSLFKQITSVVGSGEDNQVMGNDHDNYIAGGGGQDTVSGREGADTYVIKGLQTSRKRRNTVAQSNSRCIIHNYAMDKKTDLLLYDADFSDINLSAEGKNLEILSSTSAELNVVLINWFKGPQYQHLMVRSKDGIAFTPPSASGAQPGSSLVKTAVMIDKSKSDSSVTIDLTDSPFQNVERAIGSPHSDTITGNHKDNYMDPREGGGSMRGNNGSDTYVLKPGYGHNDIHNTADDSIADTVLFGANFHQIVVSNNTQSVTLNYTDPSNSTDSFSATLVDYVRNSAARHLTVVSSDGISFVISPNDSFAPVAIVINKASQYNVRQQDIYLSDTGSFGEVRTVYGFKSEANNISGNAKPNTLVGGDENDYLDGKDGNDVLKGGAGNNTLIGGLGNDTLSGGNDNDVLDGGPGNDILSPGAGDNYIDGGDGDDTIVYAGDPVSETGVYVDLNNGICQHGYGYDEVYNVENVYATPYNDTLICSSLMDNILNGEEGNDTFHAYDGYDILIGGNGSDFYNLVEATGTKVIVNEADDQALDIIDLSYVNTNKLRFEIQDNSLIFRVVSTFFANSQASLFPGCQTTVPNAIILQPSNTNVTFCETYSPQHPTVIIKDYFAGTAHRHLTITTADCSLTDTYLREQPINVVCS